MAIQRIKKYGDTLKVILKPTKLFPEGRNYFYCDSEDIDLVQSHTWQLHQCGKNSYIVFYDSWRITYYFHQELAFKYLNYYPSYLDHISGVVIDNTDNNLNEVTSQQNTYNKPTKGYWIVKNPLNKDYIGFRPQVMYNNEKLTPFKTVHSEVEACQLQHELETIYLKELMQDDYYMYNFFLDRRNDLDILDLERTKKVSSEEAVYRHVVRYAKDNAWYYYRYNLEQYFRDNHLQVPVFGVASEGFMIHPITGQRLCPF